MTVRAYTGSCHCGAARFAADIDLSEGTMRCTCSYCSKVRAWYAFVPAEPRAGGTRARYSRDACRGLAC